MNDGEKAYQIIKCYNENSIISDEHVDFIINWYNSLISFFREDRTIIYALRLKKDLFVEIKWARRQITKSVNSL